MDNKGVDMQIHRKLSIRRSHDRSGSCTGARLSYVVSHAGNLDQSEEAFKLVRQTAPDYVGSARQRSIELTAAKGDGTYEFEVNYAPQEELDRKIGNERVWSFEVTTSKYRVTEARELVKIYPGSGKITPPDPGEMIGWDGQIDGESELAGATVLIPEMFERCVATYRASKVNSAFLRKLFNLSGKVNASTFRGWDPGEVLLTRAEQGEPYKNYRDHELVDITYTFAIRPAGEVSCAGSVITPVSPWNVIWSISRRDAVTNSLIVSGIYESRVYDSGNFSALNL